MNDRSNGRVVECDKKVGVAQVLSVIAIVVSIAMPLITSVVTYMILAPAVEELKTRPKIKTVTSVNELDPDGKKSFSIMIENIGTYPARSLQLITYAWSNDVAKGYIAIAPAVEHDVAIDAGVVRLTLKRPLAPGQQVLVFFRENPMSIGLQTEYGDYTSVYSNSGGGRSSW